MTLLPALQFFTIGQPFAGILCLVLQLTLIGWAPAAIWSVNALSQYNTDKNIEKALATHRQWMHASPTSISIAPAMFFNSTKAIARCA